MEVRPVNALECVPNCSEAFRTCPESELGYRHKQFVYDIDDLGRSIFRIKQFRKRSSSEGRYLLIDGHLDSEEGGK